ncbi:TonB-dependent receptor [Mucilaginibacter sp. AW1-3]
MIRSLCLTLVFLFVSITSRAQTISINGAVIDKTTNQPLEYTNVVLYNSVDSSLVNGVVTNNTGAFAFSNLKAGNYYLKIRFIGYITRIVPNLNLTKNQAVKLGNIGISPDPKLLNEINVTGQKASVYNKIDKQVYKADQFQAAKGSNAIDVIKNMPSVSVNSQGEISMRGSAGLLVLLNGKPVQADATTILSQLPANSIENIELITSPSAKYDADGKAGIINITTKKGANNGFSVTTNVQGGLPSTYDFNNVYAPVRFGADATINYRVDKWDITAGANYLRNDIAGRREGNVNTTIADRYTTFPSLGERSFRRDNYSVRANVSFTPDKNNVLTAGFYHGERTQYRIADLIYNNTKTDINTGKTIGKTTYYNSNLVKRQGRFTLSNLDYNHTFSNKSTLALSGLVEYDELDGYTKNRNLNYPDTNTLQQYTFNNNTNPLHGYRLQADYGITVGPGKLESGYLFKYQKQNGDFTTQQQTLSSGPLITLSDNVTDVKNLIQGVYTQYSGKAGRLQYTGGLRYEYSSRNFSANQAVNLYSLYLSNLFPSASILYSVKPDLKLKAGYSRRIQRTNFNELNPYPEREHSETAELGDPNLLPEFVDLTELGLIKDFSKGSVFITGYHQQIKNAINRVNQPLTDTILLRIYTNAGAASLWGAEFGSDIKITGVWQFYLGANLYHYQINGNLFNNTIPVTNASWNYLVNVNTTVKFTASSSFNFNLNYLSERVTAQGKDSRFVTPNSSFKKTFFKGRMDIMLLWQNMSLGIIPTNQQRITTWGTNFYTTTNYVQETDMLLLNLSFNFNRLNKKARLPVSEFGDKEF